MKKLLKRAGVTLLLLVNLFVFLPKSYALPKESGYNWSWDFSESKDYGELGKAYKADCDNPTNKPECLKGESGWGFCD